MSLTFFAEVSIEMPSFRGNGHLRYRLPKSSLSPLRDHTNFSLEIKTKIDTGLILWIGEVRQLNQKYERANERTNKWPDFVLFAAQIESLCDRNSFSFR